MSKRPPPPALVDIDVDVDLAALWRGMADKLKRKGFTKGELLQTEHVFWEDLNATEDWVEAVLVEGGELAVKLSARFVTRFVAKAVRLTGRAVVASAPPAR